MGITYGGSQNQVDIHMIIPDQVCAERLLGMLQRNCQGTLRQLIQDQIALAGIQAEITEYEKSATPGLGITNPRNKLEPMTHRLRQSREAYEFDQAILDFATRRICGLIKKEEDHQK